MSLRILVVEPDSDIRWLLADLLRRRGYEVFTFADDHETLAYLHDNTLTRCIVLDSRAVPEGREHLRERCWLYQVSLLSPSRPFRIDDLCAELQRARRELGALQTRGAGSVPA